MYVKYVLLDRVVKTTRDIKAVKKDAAVWSQRIVHVLDNPQVAKSQAALLRTALKNDELSRETQDNFIAYCIGLTFQCVLSQVLFKRD